MKVKVIKKFIDKHTGEIHKPGDVLNIKKDRFDEIVKVDADLIELIADEPSVKKTTKKSVKKNAE